MSGSVARLPVKPKPVPIAAQPELRGYRVVYREGQTNHCPGCSRSNWYVGRKLAECAFCGTALPLAGAPIGG